MQRKSILSTTHVDKHNMRMTRDVLAQNAISMKGPRAAGLGVDHDVTLPPVGKWVSAYVEARPDGEFQLVGTHELVETVGQVTMPDGRVFIRQACPNDSRPFKSAEEIPTEKTLIFVDPVNFTDQHPPVEFFNSLDNEDAFEQKFLLRKSVLSDAEIVINAAISIAIWFGTHKLFNQTAQAIDQDIAAFYKLVSRSIIEFSKRVIPRNRPKTYVIIIPGTPAVEFVARTKNPSEVLAAISPDIIKPYVEQALALVPDFDAEKVQFVLQNDGTWLLSYMLTARGEIIGDPHIINRRDKTIHVMGQRANGQ